MLLQVTALKVYSLNNSAIKLLDLRRYQEGLGPYLDMPGHQADSSSLGGLAKKILEKDEVGYNSFLFTNQIFELQLPRLFATLYVFVFKHLHNNHPLTELLI